MTREYKWGNIVPLIGGMMVGPKIVTGNDPDFMVSYKPFGENERTAKHNFPTVPHFLLDEPDRQGFNVTERKKDLDFVTALCPCAGLSLLSSGSAEHRMKMNSWMFESAKFTLGELQPKVFWGENAPGLYSSAGAPVRDILRKIGEDNGYSFSVYCTNTVLHGIPQARKRTFYFFWKDSNVPVLNYYKAPEKTLTQHLAELPRGILHHKDEDFSMAENHLLTNPYIMFLQNKYQGEGINDMRKWLVTTGRKGFTLLTYLLLTDQLSEAQQWMHDNGHEKHAREAQRVINKVGSKGTIMPDGKVSSGGFWDGSFPIYRGDGPFATLISRTLYAIHPTEDRVLTLRECMHLMGLPNDYELVGDNYNVVCQNVPTCTAADMTREVVAFINGEREISTSTYMLQSNLSQRIDVQQSSLLTF